MWRALILLALVLGVVLGGLLLLLRTAKTPLPRLPREPPPRRTEEKDDDDASGW